MAEKAGVKKLVIKVSFRLVEPPFINLDEAIKIAKDIYNQGGGRLSREDLQPILQNKPTSSWFRLKVYALKSFGLINDPREETIELTPLAMSIIAPQSPEELTDAKLKALTSYSPFRHVAERYLHKPEPQRSFVENIFERELKIPGNKKAKWAQCFIDSAKAADLFKSTLEINVHSKVEVEDKPPKMDTEDKGQQQSLSRELSADEKKAGWLPYEIPVSGKDRPRIIIPPNLTRKDFEKMIKVLEALAPEKEDEVKK